MSLVFIPRSGVNYFAVKARYFSFNKFIYKYKDTLYNKPSQINAKKFIENTKSFFTNQLWIIIDEYYSYITDFFSIILNITISVFLFGMLIEWYFVLAYLIAGLITVFLVFFTEKKISKFSKLWQESQAKLHNLLPIGWDTILVGNKYNLNGWLGSFVKNKDDAASKRNHMGLYSDAASLLIMLISSVPVIIAMVSVIFESGIDKVKLSILVVTLPRQLITLQYFSVLVEYLLRYSSIKARIHQIDDKLTLTEKDNLISRIKWNEIKVYKNNEKIGTEYGDYTTLMSDLDLNKPSLITIRGCNGAGKSTLLYQIKSTIDGCFFLPVQSMLFWPDIDQNEMSTGQRMKTIIDKIINEIDDKIILIDEWDANLDENKRLELEKKISQAALVKTIIEVRHH
jgi:ABC-type bacteriocin/lantibiotic exporter with double-glycine peptidase domain